MQLGDRLQLTIEDLGHQGQGIGRHQGQVVFVAGGLPGDRLEVRLARHQRRHIEAELIAVLEPSPGRRRPPCILSDHCGGCSLQAMTDIAQRDWKQTSLCQTLTRISGLDALPLEPLRAAPSALGYRNRTVIPLERCGDGRLRAGFYRRGSHRIVNMNHCPVLDPRLDALIEPLKQELAASGWPVDRHGQGGGLRHLALRVGHHSSELLITLIAGRELPGAQELATAWLQRWPGLVGVTLNLQPEASNRLFGSRTELLAGRDWLEERFCGLSLRIASDTFFQINTTQAEAVLPPLREALGAPVGTLVDAYCGVGTYSLPLAACGWSVLGIEQHPGAVHLAQLNAGRNALQERARFLAGDVALLLPDALRQGATALLLDPPRKGLSAAVVSTILSARPARLAYLSCDPATLARDLSALCAPGGYRPSTLVPFDFFPNTTHVECLAVLDRQDDLDRQGD